MYNIHGFTFYNAGSSFAIEYHKDMIMAFIDGYNNVYTLSLYQDSEHDIRIVGVDDI